MLFVEILVNEQCVIRIGARRMKGDTCPETLNHYYMVGDERPIKHRYGDGAAKLALKMLKRYIAHRGKYESKRT